MQVKLKSLSKNEDFKFILNGKKISNRYSTIFYRRLESKSNKYFKPKSTKKCEPSYQ